MWWENPIIRKRYLRSRNKRYNDAHFKAQNNEGHGSFFEKVFVGFFFES